MLVARTLADLRQALAVASGGGGTALVPTMGALHRGHLSLLAQARGTPLTAGAPADGPRTVVTSIFVNPLQFEDADDLARYPRDEASDLAMLEEAGCDIVWSPSVQTMYPAGDATTIDVAGPALGWEGAARPGHFRGVATVVARLFGQVRPDVAIFGEKDWQQLQVIRRMTTDLALPVKIEGAPTVREADGLARSSRNRFLTDAERARAPLLFATLNGVTMALGTDALPDRVLPDRVLPDRVLPDSALPAARQVLEDAGFAVEYLALVAGETLQPQRVAVPGSRVIAAARLGRVRLIDNVAAG